jgi:predicted secreted protein
VHRLFGRRGRWWYNGEMGGGIMEKMKLFAAFVTIVALMTVALIPVDMALGQEVNPDRTLPPTVERGGTFDVIVTFTAPVDNFNAVGLTDFCSDGWNVTVNRTWCTPNADTVVTTGNRAEIAWFGSPDVGFDKGTSFSALYKVTVPEYACAGSHSINGSLEYWVGRDGPYSENVTGDSDVDVPVYDKPLICCNPKSFNFSATEGGSNPADQTLEISNSGVDTIDWTLGDDAEWLSEDPTSGSSTGELDTVDVSVDITGMSDGDYSANITITADGADNSPWTVPVSLHIDSSTPEISFDPESLSFTAVEGGSNPSPEVLDIWNSGVDILNWTLSDDAEWLSENPTGGNSTDDHVWVSVLVDSAGMSAGDYSADITITADGAGNSPQKVPVSLHISTAAAPVISFTPKSLSFTAGEESSNPANQTLEIWNSGADTLHWTLGDDAAWLSENPTSGSSTGERDTVILSVDIAGMSDGAYSTSITITSPEASNSPQTVPITLYVGVSPPEPAQFTITGLDVTPEQVPPGQPVTISAQVTNTGGSEGSCTVNLTVNGQVEQTKTVTLAPEAMETVTFTVTKETPGSYTVSIGDLTEEFTVAASSWLNRYWWVIVVGIAAIVLLAYLLWRKRAA